MNLIKKCILTTVLYIVGTLMMLESNKRIIFLTLFLSAILLSICYNLIINKIRKEREIKKFKTLYPDKKIDLKEYSNYKMIKRLLLKDYSDDNNSNYFFIVYFFIFIGFMKATNDQKFFIYFIYAYGLLFINFIISMIFQQVYNNQLLQKLIGKK